MILFRRLEFAVAHSAVIRGLRMLIAEYFSVNTLTIRRILEVTQRGDGDITLWIKWFLECLERALLNTENVLSAVFAKAEEARIM